MSKQKDERVEITKDNAKEVPNKDQGAKKRYIIPEQFNTILSIGMKYSSDHSKESGVVRIYDGDIAVIEIDRKALAKIINDKIAERKTSTGLTKLFDVRADAVEVNYSRTDGSTLSVDGVYNDLVFWMA